MQNDPLIVVDNLTYHYPEATHDAIDHVSLQIPRNSWTVIVGKNGSGKSTLAQLIAGLRPSKSGQISFDGYPVDDSHMAKLRSSVGYLFQDPDNQFVGATVADDVAFGMENQNIPFNEMQARVASSLKQVGMEKFADARPEHLSGGQKQRVALAGVFAVRPSLLILDEATSMIDPEGRQTMFDAIKNMQQKSNLTVLSITHDDDEMEYADYMVVLQSGKVVATGSPEMVDPKIPYIPKPAGERLRQALIKRGAPVPDHYVSTKEMSQWIGQQLNSNR